MSSRLHVSDPIRHPRLRHRTSVVNVKFEFVHLLMLKFRITRKWSAGCTLLDQRCQHSSLHLVNSLSWRFPFDHYTLTRCSWRWRFVQPTRLHDVRVHLDIYIWNCGSSPRSSLNFIRRLAAGYYLLLQRERILYCAYYIKLVWSRDWDAVTVQFSSDYSR